VSDEVNRRSPDRFSVVVNHCHGGTLLHLGPLQGMSEMPV
jgi:hypothetical protein